MFIYVCPTGHWSFHGQRLCNHRTTWFVLQFITALFMFGIICAVVTQITFSENKSYKLGKFQLCQNPLDCSWGRGCGCFAFILPWPCLDLALTLFFGEFYIFQRIYFFRHNSFFWQIFYGKQFFLNFFFGEIFFWHIFLFSKFFSQQNFFLQNFFSAKYFFGKLTLTNLN